ncbi:unnamed protein product [Withania somnifera]
MERYEIVKELGSGNFGVAKLVCDKKTKEFFAVKFIERGQKIDEHVQREIMNHRSLKHPNIVRFKEVLLTPTHLAIVMEYAAGGELFARICKAGRFNEDEARFFFQQLISGVSYCHFMQICHRDLKLENTLLDGSAAPRVKICDFGYSKLADVWSCGVTLYIMLVGAYPFQDPSDAKNFTKTIAKILSVCYSIPEQVKISLECHHLLNRIFVADPEKRITIPEIKMHPWFLKNLPVELMEGGSYQCVDVNNPSQSMEEVLAIIQEARVPLLVPKSGTYSYGGSMELDELDEADVEDVTEISGDFAGLL